MRRLAAILLLLVLLLVNAQAQTPCDACLMDDSPSCDSLICACPKSKNKSRVLNRTPAMIGDFFRGPSASISGQTVIDRLVVLANDLDAPNPLPGAGSALTISEPGPVGIFESSLGSIQELQALLQSGGSLPPATLVGTISDNASLTSISTVGQIQTLLASTPSGYDIVGLVAPSGSYSTAVHSLFQNRNNLAGSTVFDSAGSGAVLQGGDDTLNGGEDLDAFYFFDYQIALNIALPDIASGGVGRVKLAEGGSVLPQDRVFFRYSYFDLTDVSYSNGGLSRFTPGFERTFHDGLWSLELRAPFAANATSSLDADGSQTVGSSNARFGNLMLYAKSLLMQGDNFAVTGGLGLQLPTADDLTVALAGTPLFAVENDAVHFQPFLGLIHQNSDRLFGHGFLQFDFAAGDNNVLFNSDGSGLVDAGAYSDRNHLFVNYGVGYWLYRSDSANGLTGIIPTFELHHTTSISDAESVNAGGFVIGGTQADTSYTNFVVGSTFEVGQSNHVTFAYTGPLGDEQYSGGFRMMMSMVR